MTNLFKSIQGWAGGTVLIAGLLAGCGHFEGASGSRNPGAVTGPGGDPPPVPSAVLGTGDVVIISYSDLPPPGLLDQKMRIGEDGKITLHLNVTVQAAGKTARQLEQEIRSEYVPRYYKYLTVTVKTDERFYFVGGEVRIPNRQLYLGEMTVLRAIDTAGGFTDFANRRNIELRRVNGQKVTINWYKAVKDPSLDPPVFPNDQIIVNKRYW